MSIQKAGLEQLEARLQEDLSRLELPAKTWVHAHTVDGEKVEEVVIIGGGMAGLTAAAALRFLGIEPVVLDASPVGYEGPWATTARMETLRSPKQLTGPALGIPSLTFRAWYEAQFGAQQWAELDKIPRLQWMDYLRWYRTVLQLPVKNEHKVTAVELHPEPYITLTVQAKGQTQQLLARRIILATGRDGLGGPTVPAFLDTIPRQFWAHSSDPYDYEQLRGKKVAVIGAGASAMDSAATALESGAERVDLLIRRATIPTVNKGKGAGNPGIVNGFYGLADEWKWRIRHYINVQQVPPPRNSTLRVSSHDNAYFNVDCQIKQVQVKNQQLHIATTQGEFVVDFLIAATGFKIDWQLRPEYASFAPFVRTWADRYTPPAGQEDAELSACPDLDAQFAFQAKDGVDAKSLSHIYCFNYPAVATHGTVSGDIPAISDGAQAIARNIAGSLYQEDIEQYYQRLVAFSEPELEGDEWQPASPNATESA